MKSILFSFVAVCFYCSNAFSQNRNERILEVRKSPSNSASHSSLSDSTRVFKPVNEKTSPIEKADTVMITDRILILKPKKEDETP